MEPKYKVGSWIMWKDKFGNFTLVSRITGYGSASGVSLIYFVKVGEDKSYPAFPEEILDITKEELAIYLLEN